MDTSAFSQQQKQALVDLLIIGMYSDHRLILAEDDRVQRLLDTFELRSDYAREQLLDGAFTRVSRHVESPAATRAYVEQLAAGFASLEVGRQAVDALSDLLESDCRFSDEERALLALVRDVFQV